MTDRTANAAGGTVPDVRKEAGNVGDLPGIFRLFSAIPDQPDTIFQPSASPRTSAKRLYRPFCRINCA